RKRSRLKRVVVSERNYFALKELGRAGDSFNDMISKLLRIERIYQEMKKQQIQQQQESNDKDNSTGSGRLPFPGSVSRSFDEHNRQQIARVLSDIEESIATIFIPQVPAKIIAGVA
ncbi:MAG: hypothetical protein M3218_03255, partial [Thermoproteota archaeon]|nr:hypothetical protein [Thermoproteota archaeon]